MRRTVTFLHGFLDYPRGATVPLRDYASYRAYRAGRSAAGRLRGGSRSTPAYLLGPDHFAERPAGTAAHPATATSSLVDAR